MKLVDAFMYRDNKTLRFRKKYNYRLLRCPYCGKLYSNERRNWNMTHGHANSYAEILCKTCFIDYIRFYYDNDKHSALVAYDKQNSDFKYQSSYINARCYLQFHKKT